MRSHPQYHGAVQLRLHQLLSERGGQQDAGAAVCGVREQLETLRCQLGSGGKVQITSGEVTLLPVDQLGRIIAYALQLGLDPMVMTNGQRLLQVPDYLPELILRYGLEKISVHIDTTQRGRPGMPADADERRITGLRDRFARLIREARNTTGRPLHAAQTVTVTPENASGIPDIVRWALKNADAFRIISFLPVAEVGRTEDSSAAGLELDQLWEDVCRGFGRRVNSRAILFGHAECNITVPLIVVSTADRREVIELVREGNRWDEGFAARSLCRLVPGYDFNRSIGCNIPQLVLRCLADPLMTAEAVAYGGYRLWGARGLFGRVLRGLLRGQCPRVRPLLVVVHKFMSPEELDTELGRERLQACVFKLPVDGRLVSMCQMNATDLRRRLNLRQQADQSTSD